MEVAKCPTCGKTFDNPKALGPHRRQAHGYRVTDGKDHPELAGTGGQKKKKLTHSEKIKASFDAKRGQYPCPQCDFVASWTGGLKKHITAMHTKKENAIVKVEGAQDAQTKVSYTNGHEDRGQHRLETAVAFASGRITELLQSVAISYDVPPRTFAGLVLRSLGKAT